MKESTFLTDFLQLSDYRTWLFIGVMVVLMAGIRQMEKKKIKFSTRMIAGTAIGLVLGGMIQLTAGVPKDPSGVAWLKEVSSWYGLIGNGYMDLLKMLVIPLVFLSIVRVIMNMQGENLGKMTAKTIGMLIGTTLIAAVIGMTGGIIFRLGDGLQVEAEAATI